MMSFTIATLSRNTLGLRELLDRFAAEQWIPAYYTPEQPDEIVPEIGR